MEPWILASSYKDEPILIFAGRGIGALHLAPGGKKEYVAFYHSEYLSWMDRGGLIGLIAVTLVYFGVILRGLALSRSEIPQLRCYGVTCLLLYVSLMAEGVFHPILSNVRGAALLVCFIGIMANWQHIHKSFYEEIESYDNLTGEPELICDDVVF